MDIWRDGRAYALDIAKRAGLNFDARWYSETEPLPA